jgi:hypothetical protein
MVKPSFKQPGLFVPVFIPLDHRGRPLDEAISLSSTTPLSRAVNGSILRNAFPLVSWWESGFLRFDFAVDQLSTTFKIVRGPPSLLPTAPQVTNDEQLFLNPYSAQRRIRSCVYWLISSNQSKSERRPPANLVLDTDRSSMCFDGEPHTFANLS